jgi:hypothetical protein
MVDGVVLVDPATLDAGSTTVGAIPRINAVMVWFNFFYPYLSDATNVRYVSPSDIRQAVIIAENYRPKCLGEAQQDQAQAHYAAYVLDFRYRSEKLSSIVGTVNTGTVAGPVIEKREGDTSVKFATSTTTSVNTLAQSQSTGPGTPYAAWDALWGICLGVVAPGEARVRIGGIITRFGFPK